MSKDKTPEEIQAEEQRKSVKARAKQTLEGGSPDDMMIASDTATVEIDGVPFFLKRGTTRARRGDRLVRESAHLWDEADATYANSEQATENPGQRRGQ